MHTQKDPMQANTKKPDDVSQKLSFCLQRKVLQDHKKKQEDEMKKALTAHSNLEEKQVLKLEKENEEIVAKLVDTAKVDNRVPQMKQEDEMKKAPTAHSSLEKENEEIVAKSVVSAKVDNRCPRMNYYDGSICAKTMVQTPVIKSTVKTARAPRRLHAILERMNYETPVTSSQIEIHLSFVPPKNGHSACLQDSAERNKMAVRHEKQASCSRCSLSSPLAGPQHFHPSQKIFSEEHVKHPSKCVKKVEFVMPKLKKAKITKKTEAAMPKLRKMKKIKHDETTMPKRKEAKNPKQNKATLPGKKTGKLSKPKTNLKSYEMTPPRSAHKSYDICDINTDDDDDSETTTHKPIPEWAHGIMLKNRIIQQHHNCNSTTIFGDYIDMPDLSKMFGIPLDENKYHQRSSSGNWSTPENFS